LVTTQTAAAIRPRWSPDGRSIAFGQNPHGSLDVYVMEVEGGFPRRLTDSESMDGAESWSRDGRWIYFFSDRTGSYQIWKVPAVGGEPIQLTTQGGVLPKESADGRFVFYLSGSPPFSIWKVPVDGGEESLVLERPGFSRSGFEIWGENLVYLLRDESAGPRIERLDLRTGQLFTVAELGPETRIGKYGRISVSPDGRWILYPQDDSRGADLVMIEDFH
jgi:Tol biopolymer transport system component